MYVIPLLIVALSITIQGQMAEAIETKQKYLVEYKKQAKIEIYRVKYLNNVIQRSTQIEPHLVFVKENVHNEVVVEPVLNQPLLVKISWIANHQGRKDTCTFILNTESKQINQWLEW